MVEEPEATLLAAVHANPEDEQARAVYADWLEGRGDPRGEYLRLELQRVTIPRRLAEIVAHIEPDWIRMVHGKFRIWITSYGDAPIHAIRVVRELTNMALADAKMLVMSVSDGVPALLFDEIDLDRARDVVRYCEGFVALRIDPALPSLVSVGPPPRLYRVLLVGLIDANQLVGELHHRGHTEEDARAITEQVAAGNAYELASRIGGSYAAELAVQFCEFSMVRTERVQHGG
jgi:uncharacterized protein (TIGR02996 family)